MARYMIKPVEMRFFEKVAFVDKWFERDGVTTRCMEWFGCGTQGGGGGYGKFAVVASMPQKWVLAHRWLYERWVAPIPKGLTLDHLCRNRACVAPLHLEPVSLAENVRRSLGKPSSQNDLYSRRKPEGPGYCRSGKHLKTPENRGKNGNTTTCKPCNRERQAEARARRVAKRAT